jgi:hypothetical protein
VQANSTHEIHTLAMAPKFLLSPSLLMLLSLTWPAHLAVSDWGASLPLLLKMASPPATRHRCPPHRTLVWAHHYHGLDGHGKRHGIALG